MHLCIICIICTYFYIYLFCIYILWQYSGSPDRYFNKCLLNTQLLCAGCSLVLKCFVFCKILKERVNERSPGRWEFSFQWKTHSVINNGIIKIVIFAKYNHCPAYTLHMAPQPASPHLAGNAASPPASPSCLSVHYRHLWEAFRHSRCEVSPARRPFQTQIFTCMSIKAIDLSYDNKKLTAAKQSFWEKPSEHILACSRGEKAWLISSSPPNLREEK